MAIETPHLVFELQCRRECYTRERGKLVRNSARDHEIPERPPFFRPMRGGYHPIAEEAIKLNEAQRRSGFQDYLYFPETVEADPEGHR